jgi:hypothetical protein
MMEDKKLQLLIGLFGELKTGQEELKKELKTGRRSEARRQMAESARTPPCRAHQSDEKQRLYACVAALERQNEE